MTEDKVPLALCAACRRQAAGPDAENISVVEHAYQCVLCFGILDQGFIDEVAAHVAEVLKTLPYDAKTFILALNLPFSQTLREVLIAKLRPDFAGTLASVPYKIRNINAYLTKLGNASDKRPTLNSDLQLLITFENDEFHQSDLEFLREKFSDVFRAKKRKFGHDDANSTTPECSKQHLQQVAGRIDVGTARKYAFKQPSRKCTFRLDFERDPVYVAGRYCKYSRSLPQSPWSEDRDAAREPGNSVSEKVCDVLKAAFGASDSRFVTSGREDIDVRMLGDGRPFVVELRNCLVTNPLKGLNYLETLPGVAEEMNKSPDVCIKFLTRVSKDVAEKLSVGEEEKRKQYVAFCYSSLPINDEQFSDARSKIPIEVIQKTPIRVLKRRSLLDRPRSVFSMDFLKLDEHHFLVRLETQAGTYVKEFVHGDFGRTQPSLAELLGVEKGEVDILELDVEKVDLEWPPNVASPVVFR